MADLTPKDYANYDLSKYPTTYDIAAWSVIAAAHGVKHVRFVIDNGMAKWKYPEYLAWKRLGNICIPITILAGLEFSVGSAVKGAQEFPYLIGDVEKCYKALGRVGKLQDVIGRDNPGPYITVTLRQSFRNKYRNSNMKAWEQFMDYAEKSDMRVIVFPECESAPIDVFERMNVYAGAEMNLGVNGGPMTLCCYSDAPYILINMLPENNTDEKTYDLRRLHDSCGFPEGSQFSFKNDKQVIVWEPDSFENIVGAYETMMNQQKASPERKLASIG